MRKNLRTSFGDIKKGEKGGYIEKIGNLSGNAWVSGNAVVRGNATVSPINITCLKWNVTIFKFTRSAWNKSHSGAHRLNLHARGRRARMIDDEYIMTYLRHWSNYVKRKKLPKEKERFIIGHGWMFKESKIIQKMILGEAI